MSENRFVRKSFGVFFHHHPAKIIILFLITLLQSFCQGISIALLIPLLGLLDSTHTAGQTNKWAELLNDFFGKIGIEVSMGLILAFFTLCLLFVAILNYFQSILQATYQQSFSYEMRKRLFKKIIASDWAFLNGKSKHNHIQILTTEIPKMANYYYFYLSLVTKSLFIAAHVCVAILISIRFTLFVVFIGFLVLFLLRKYIIKAEKLGNANIQVFRKMLKRIDDFWLTVKIAKVHNSETFYYKKFDESNIQMLEYQNKQVKNKAVSNLLFSLSGVLSLVMVVFFAYNEVHLPFALIFVLILLFSRIFPQFMSINGDINMLFSNVSSVKMVLKLDQELNESRMEEDKRIEEVEYANQLEIKGLNFAYPSKAPLFTDFSVIIPAKKITGIIGKSGCGKTTLIDIIAGLQKISNGVIEVDGTALTEEKLYSWRSGLGYLPQDSFFIDGTIRENLVWDSKQVLSDEDIMDALKLVNADHLVMEQQKGLDTSIANYQYHFSGGERQRLALARVMLRKPQLLLLDEATSALDYENESQIMACLVNLKKEVSILFITHHYNLADYFDVIIDLGRMKSPDSLDTK